MVPSFSVAKFDSFGESILLVHKDESSVESLTPLGKMSARVLKSLIKIITVIKNPLVRVLVI